MARTKMQKQRQQQKVSNLSSQEEGQVLELEVDQRGEATDDDTNEAAADGNEPFHTQAINTIDGVDKSEDKESAMKSTDDTEDTTADGDEIKPTKSASEETASENKVVYEDNCPSNSAIDQQKPMTEEVSRHVAATSSAPPVGINDEPAMKKPRL